MHMLFYEKYKRQKNNFYLFNAHCRALSLMIDTTVTALKSSQDSFKPKEVYILFIFNRFGQKIL